MTRTPGSAATAGCDAGGVPPIRIERSVARVVDGNTQWTRFPSNARDPRPRQTASMKRDVGGEVIQAEIV